MSTKRDKNKSIDEDTFRKVRSMINCCDKSYAAIAKLNNISAKTVHRISNARTLEQYHENRRKEYQEYSSTKKLDELVMDSVYNRREYPKISAEEMEESEMAIRKMAVVIAILIYILIFVGMALWLGR